MMSMMITKKNTASTVKCTLSGLNFDALFLGNLCDLTGKTWGEEIDSKRRLRC